MAQQDNTVLMEGVSLMFRNFEGKKGKFNEEGERSFAVRLSDNVAETLANDGWNVKVLAPRPEDEEGVPQPFLPVALRYDIRPPRIVLVTSKKRRTLEEREVSMLDSADIVNVDIIVRPYNWSNARGESGIKAYVQTMYVTIQEDALELKYAELYPED